MAVEAWKRADGAQDGRIKFVRVSGDGSRVQEKADGKWKERSISLDSPGYPQVHLKDHIRGGVVTSRVHRLVAHAFHGPCPDGKEVCHNDGDRTNNHPGNLRYGTRSENQMDRVDHGTSNRGRNNGRAKLNDRQVYGIRRLWATGEMTQQLLAETYGVSRSLISYIINGRSWSHITLDNPPNIDHIIPRQEAVAQ